MAANLPPVGEFAHSFVEFMQAMHEAALAPDGPWVAQLREHLGVEPGGLPVTTKTFRMADRPNLQLGLDAVLPDSERPAREQTKPLRSASSRRRVAWMRSQP